MVLSPAGAVKSVERLFLTVLPPAGVVLAVRGRADPAGVFVVEDLCYMGMAAQVGIGEEGGEEGGNHGVWSVFRLAIPPLLSVLHGHGNWQCR